VRDDKLVRDDYTKRTFKIEDNYEQDLKLGGIYPSIGDIHLVKVKSYPLLCFIYFEYVPDEGMPKQEMNQKNIPNRTGKPFNNRLMLTRITPNSGTSKLDTSKALSNPLYLEIDQGTKIASFGCRQELLNATIVAFPQYNASNAWIDGKDEIHLMIVIRKGINKIKFLRIRTQSYSFRRMMSFPSTINNYSLFTPSINVVTRNLLPHLGASKVDFNPQLFGQEYTLSARNIYAPINSSDYSVCIIDQERDRNSVYRKVVKI
jgi:hypothetical protein